MPMNAHPTRREFLRRTATAVTGFALAPSLLRAAPANASSANTFSFVLLGDLHYDKLEHHDLAWLDRTHPNDLSQIKNYTRITAEVMPETLMSIWRAVMPSAVPATLKSMSP